MPTQDHANRLGKIIEGTGLAQPVLGNFADSRINVLCRVQDSNSKPWTEMIERLLLSTEQHKTWQAHVCKHYFLKEVGNQKKMVWGWNISIQAHDMNASLDIIAKVFRGEALQNTQFELTEFPLAGSPSTKTKRLVHSIGDGDFHPGKSR
jgi:hypothetical protein